MILCYNDNEKTSIIMKMIMFFCIAGYICSLIDKNLEDVPIDCSSCHENQEEILSLY